MLDLVTYIWDLLEFTFQLMMLFIVLKYTTREDASRNASENSTSSGVGNSGHARVSKNVVERYNAHSKNMEQWELDALNKRQQGANLDERIGRSFFRMSKTDDDLMNEYLDPSENAEEDVLLAQTLEDFMKSCQ